MDLTVSPLTAEAFESPNENNSLHITDTLVDQRNFAVMNFSGPRKNANWKLKYSTRMENRYGPDHFSMNQNLTYVRIPLTSQKPNSEYCKTHGYGFPDIPILFEPGNRKRRN